MSLIFDRFKTYFIYIITNKLFKKAFLSRHYVGNDKM